MAVQAKTLVDGPDSRQVDADTAGGLQASDDHEPYGEQAQFVAGKREPLDVCKFEKFQKGSLFAVEGAAGTGSPSTRLEDVHVMAKNPNGAAFLLGRT